MSKIPTNPIRTPTPDLAALAPAADGAAAAPPPGAGRFADDPKLAAVSRGAAVLTVGSTGDGVSRVQQALLDLGYANPELMRRGTYDDATRHAVLRFQRDAGVGADGRVGKQTLDALTKRSPAPGEQLDVAPEYARLRADHRTDVTIAIGFDEGQDLGDGHHTPGAHLAAEATVLAGLHTRGFAPKTADQIRAMSPETRDRLGLDDTRLDPHARYFVKDDGVGKKDDAVVRLITPSEGGAEAKKSFAQSLQQDEVVIYAGHARYGTGPDFDHKTNSGAGNFVIDGHGNREHDRPPAALKAILGNKDSRSDLATLKEKPAYQLLVFNACSTEEYLHNLRDPKRFARDLDDTDIIVSTMPTRIATNPDHTLGFLDGVLRGDSARTMVERESKAEVDFLENFAMDDEAKEAHLTYTTSGFLGNPSNTVVPAPPHDR